MESRVKAFFDEGVVGLEKKINYFLTNMNGTLIDIKYDAIINVKDWGPSALVVYIPEVKKKKKGKKSEKKDKDTKKDEKGDARVQGGDTPQRKQKGTSSAEQGAGSSDRDVGSKKSRSKNT